MQIFVRCPSFGTRCINFDKVKDEPYNCRQLNTLMNQLVTDELNLNAEEIGVLRKGHYYSFFEFFPNEDGISSQKQYTNSSYLENNESIDLIPKLRGGAVSSRFAATFYSMFSPSVLAKRFPSTFLFFNGLKSVVKDIGQFYPPIIPMAYWAIPCGINVYGIWLFKNPDFLFSKPNQNVSAISIKNADESEDDSADTEASDDDD